MGKELFWVGRTEGNLKETSYKFHPSGIMNSNKDEYDCLPPFLIHNFSYLSTKIAFFATKNEMLLWWCPWLFDSSFLLPFSLYTPLGCFLSHCLLTQFPESRMTWTQQHDGTVISACLFAFARICRSSGIICY